MLTEKQYSDLQRQLGQHSSWAVWAEPGSGNWKSKENIGDLEIFQSLGIQSVLNPNIVLLGLCRSREYEMPEFCAPSWINFHDGRSCSQDYKLRYALRNTIMWGAFLTDLNCTDIVQPAKNVQLTAEQCYAELYDKLKRLPATKSFRIIAFGCKTYSFLQKPEIRKKLQKDFFGCKVYKLTHYSMFLSLEQYADEAMALNRELLKDGYHFSSSSS